MPSRHQGKQPAVAPAFPDRVIELEHIRELQGLYGQDVLLAGVDEVGRGALAGPVSVGIAVVDTETPNNFPEGLRDSKQLSARARERLVGACRDWPRCVVVGHAGPDVVNSEGIIGALRAAAADAMRQLAQRGLMPHGILLDGTHDWWSHDSLFGEAVLPALPVRTVVKGDAACAVIAAASVVAKVERDAMMVEYAEEYPGYDWEHNKGYSSKSHIEGLSTLGPSALHRTSWNLPGLSHS